MLLKPYASKPLGLPAKVGAQLLGVSLPTIYRRIAEGNLPVLPGGQKLVIVAKLEETIGRPLTLDEINGAVAVVADAEAKAGV